MGYTKVALEDKILEMYPEIAKCCLGSFRGKDLYK